MVSRRVSRIDNVVEELIHASCTRETLYLPREFRFAPRKKLDSSNGTRRDGIRNEQMDFVLLGKTFRYILAKRLEDRMLSDERLPNTME